MLLHICQQIPPYPIIFKYAVFLPRTRIPTASSPLLLSFFIRMQAEEDHYRVSPLISGAPHSLFIFFDYKELFNLLRK